MTGSALAFPTPASLGSLDHYIQAVNRFPLLTAEQEQDLARRWRAHEDVGAARQLVLSEGTVRNHLSSVYRKLGVSSRAQAIVKSGNFGG